MKSKTVTLHFSALLFLALTSCSTTPVVDRLSSDPAAGYVEFSPQGGSATSLSKEGQTIARCNIAIYDADTADTKAKHLGSFAHGSGQWPISDAKGNTSLTIPAKTGKHTYRILPASIHGDGKTIEVNVLGGMVTPVKVRVTYASRWPDTVTISAAVGDPVAKVTK